MPVIVDISHLDFAYGQQLVLKHINLQIEAGTTLGLIGPNGGGKTTLMRLMLGLHRPTRGSVTVAGMSPGQAVRAGDVIGYLPQKPHFAGNIPMSVRHVVRLGLAGKTGMLRPYAKDDLDFVEHLVDRIGLRDFADAPVGQLSGGQAQRAFIARALAARPKILLLDEPTTGIDRSGQQKFIEQVLRLKAELGLTVVFCSHDLRAVSSISDRVACLNLTLHYHDVPHRMPERLAVEMFACDLEAMGVTPGVEPPCACGEPHEAPGSARLDGVTLPMLQTRSGGEE
jgi:zinc transport system ATP-binding protein